MIKFTRPTFNKTLAHLDKIRRFDPRSILNEYGRLGVNALSNATPVDTGLTAASWSYKVTGRGSQYRLTWHNSRTAGSSSVPLVILLQFGHRTKDGFFLSGRDFINPALKPVFDSLVKRLAKEIIR